MNDNPEVVVALDVDGVNENDGFDVVSPENRLNDGTEVVVVKDGKLEIAVVVAAVESKVGAEVVPNEKLEVVAGAGACACACACACAGTGTGTGAEVVVEVNDGNDKPKDDVVVVAVGVVAPKLNEGADVVAPKVGNEALTVVVVILPKAGAEACAAVPKPPKVGAAFETVPNPVATLNAGADVVAPNVGADVVTPKLAPKAGAVEVVVKPNPVPKAGAEVDGAPNEEAPNIEGADVVAPNAGVEAGAPNPGVVVVAPKAGAAEAAPKAVEPVPKAGAVEVAPPNDEPNESGADVVVVAPKAEPKAGAEVAGTPNADAPKAG